MVILLLLTFSVSKAQEAYQPGYAILNDGTRISGSIILYDEAPWFNQRFIFLKDSTQLAGDPNTKAKKYKVADLKFYQVGTRAFDKVHFVDAENLQVKSFGANDHMLERLASGRIQAHRFTPTRQTSTPSWERNRNIRTGRKKRPTTSYVDIKY
jgi:hypothetical protein